MTGAADGGVTAARAGRDDEGASLVRGGLLLTAAKVVHTAAGWGLWFFLFQLFDATLGAGAVAAFGVYGTTVDAVLNPLNMMFAQGALQTTSHAVSRWGREAVVACLRLQVVLVVVVLGAFQLAAPWVAGTLLGDPSYTPHLRLGGLIPACYGLRCVVQGAANATHRFGLQSALDMGSSAGRTLLVLAGAGLGYGVTGALSGFVASAAIMTVVAFAVVLPRLRTARPPAAGTASHAGATPDAKPDRTASGAAPAVGTARGLLSFQVRVLVLVLATWWLLGVDVLAVKIWAADDAATADRLAGYLTAQRKIAQVPWGLVLGLAWVLFPVAARAGDPERSREVVRHGLRVALALLVVPAALLLGSAEATVELLFPGMAERAVAHGDPADLLGAPLVALAPGSVALGLLTLGSLLVTASGAPGASLAVVLSTLALALGLARAGVVAHGPVGAAAAVALAWTVGAALVLAVLVRRLGACVPWGAWARTLATGLVLAGAARAWDARGPWLLAEDALLAAAGLGLLVVTGVVTPGELRRLLPARRRS